MKYKRLLFLIFIFMIIFSVNMVSATDMAENTTVLSDNPESLMTNSIDSDLSVDIASENILSENGQVDLSSEDNEYVIYIGQNSENGDGSESNPFANFTLACNNVSDGIDNVVVKVFDGTYYLDSHLKFNTTNIHIIGLGNNVIIKNKYATEEPAHTIPKNVQQAFGLVSTSGNFRISNITFDGSTWNVYASPTTVNSYYNIFKGSGDSGSGNYTVTLDNCTIFNFKYFIPSADRQHLYQFIFNNCNIVADPSTYYKWGNNDQNNILFKECVFDITLGQGKNIDITPKYVNNTFEDCWFGINGIPSYFKQSFMQYYHFNSYAIFTISEKYLGDNTYEIIGKLLRNGTSEIIEGINPMSVTLKVDNGGELDQETAILKNGTFKVLYTSTSSDNKITATLDKQPVSIEFKSIDISLDSPVITYGDKQNITVSLPESIYNGVVTVIVNGKPYTKDVEFGNAEVTVDISDVLPVGTHDVNVTFVDKIDNPALPIYGFNTTKITVNKAIPNVNISLDGDLNPGEKLIVKVEIPYATEDVTIIVNGDKNTTKLVDNVATYTIDELVAGTYYVTVLYAGDDSYDFAVKTDSFDVVKSTQELIKDLNDTVNAQADTIVNQSKQISDLNSTVNAQADTIVNQSKQISDLNSTVNTQADTIVNQSKQISDLNNTINAQSSTTNSQKDTNNQKNEVTKKSTKLTAPKKTFKAKTKTKKIKIKLTTGKTALKNKKITLKVKGKTYTAKTNKKGIATFKITKLTKKGTFKYTVKFAGDKAYKAVSKNGKLKIK